MSEILHNQSQESVERGETIPTEALRLHEETRNAIAAELGIESLAAERETGQLFVDKVDFDIQEHAPHDEIITDVDAALISGGIQLEAASVPLGGGESDIATQEALLQNLIVELESTHPDLVTEAVAELAGSEKTSKLAHFVAIVTDKIKALASRVTPVIAPTGTVMSLHSANKYREFAKAVGEARAQLTGSPYEDFFHSSPTLEEFKEWKKTGVVEAGITPPSSFAPPEPVDSWEPWKSEPLEMPPLPPDPPEATMDLWGDKLPNAPSVSGNTLNNEDFLLPAQETVIPSELPTDYYQVEQSYEESVVIDPVEASTELTLEAIAGRLELDRTVKRAPRLTEQIQDSTRTNSILYVDGQHNALHTHTSNGEYRANRESISEQSALRQLNDFLEAVTSSESPYANKAAKMQEALTFIGEKEYKEAVAGIAAYWKTELDKNESLKIFAVAGEIAKSGGYKDGQGSDQIKSDDFLLENILSHFSDEDLAKYGDRVIVSYDDLVDTDAKDLKVVLLDDWTISGSQLNQARASFVGKYPHLAGSVEIQLIAANERRIKHGLIGYSSSGKQISTPVRAYYAAHHSEYGYRSESHITGFHSSVDFDFEIDIEDMVSDMRSRGHDVAMVAPTNIVRPYRYDGVSRGSFIHRERVRQQAKQRNRERVLT